MKKLLLSLLLACSTAAPSWAVKAWPFPVEVTQSDGTQLTILGQGDEHFHYFTTTDDVLLVRESGAYYIAAIQADGSLSSTGILAHNAGQRSVAEQAAAARQDKSLLQHKVATTRSAVTRTVTKDSYASYPWEVIEKPRVLVILAQFPDMHFHTTETINNVETQLDPKTIFDQYFNAMGTIDPSYGTVSKNHGSVKQYFSDMSGGQFAPQFDIYGPVTLDHNYAYYGKGTDNMSTFVPDVCKKADEAGVDFSQYDQNNDGFVDLVYIVYAGWGENITPNSSDCIWPKSGIVSGGTYDGKQVCLFGVNNEMNGNDPTTGKATMWINGIGTFCHEFSHCIGLPDFYPTTSGAVRSANNQAMGFYDLMDMGNFQNNGFSPKAYTAFEREIMGWDDIIDLDKSGSYTAQPLIDKGKAYRVRNPQNENEYIVLENLQNQSWDKSTTYIGHGLLAYHVEYDENIFNILTYNLKTNTVNNTLGHPRMAVIPADGLMLSDKSHNVTNAYLFSQQRGDTFSDKSQSGVTQLTDEQSLPNFLFYTSTTGGKTNFALKNIAEHADGSVTFDYIADVASGISHATTDNENGDNRIYTLSGVYVGTDLSSLPKGVYIKNHKKIVKE